MKRKEGGFLVVQALIAIGVLALVALPSTTSIQTSQVSSSSYSSSSSTRPLSPSTYTFYSTTTVGFNSTTSSPSSGLELIVYANTTTVRSGGAIDANITLFNPLDQYLSLSLSYPANSTILKWASGYDFICGGWGSPIALTPILGYALFRGYYAANNASLAGTPLELAPPWGGLNCGTFTNPDSIVFRGGNDFAVVADGPTGQGGTLEEVTLAATTESCTTYYCGAGNGLFGYWVAPGTATFSQQDAAIGSRYFRFFPPGEYTLAVEDIWNDSVFVHFTVLPSSAKISMPVTGAYASTLALNGLELSTFINSTNLAMGQSLNVSMSVTNTLPTTNFFVGQSKLGASGPGTVVGNWTFYGIPVSTWTQCGTNISFGWPQPVEVVILKGNYTAQQLPSTVNTAAPYRCIYTGTTPELSFLPHSDQFWLEGVFGGGVGQRPLQLLSLASQFTISGYWNAGTLYEDDSNICVPAASDLCYPPTTIPFSSGVYTIGVSDEWGQSLVVHFTVKEG